MLEERREKLFLDIESILDDYPFSKFIFKNPTFCSGLNIYDFFEILQFPNSVCIYSMKINRNIRDLIGDVYINSDRIEKTGDLWERFISLREDLIRYFLDNKELQKSIKLEDVILLDKIFRYDLIGGNLNIKKINRDRETSYSILKTHKLSTQSLTHLLHDFSCFLAATTSFDEEIKFFLIEAEDRNGIIWHNLVDLYEFLNFRRRRKDCVYKEFIKWIQEQMAPEFCDRFWENLIKRQKGWQNDFEKDAISLQAINIPNNIIYIDNNPSLTLHVLQDTLKNSLGWTVSNIINLMKERN